MIVSSDIQLWRQLLYQEHGYIITYCKYGRLYEGFAELDTGDHVVWVRCPVRQYLVNINSFISQSFVWKRVFWLTGKRTVFTQPSVSLRSVLPIVCICVPRLVSQTAGWLYLLSSVKNDTSAATVRAPPAPAPHPCGKHPQRDSEHMLAIMQKTPGFISISLLIG